MPDTKITALTALTTADPATDMMPIVDVSDTTMAASGTTKRISINNILACSPSATLASATITGNLTVDTNTLFVDSANNRVGVGTATPAAQFHILAPGSDTAAIRLAATGGRVFEIGSTGAGYGSANNLIIYDITGSAERYRIDSTGICTWSNVGGVAGTAMTLNSTGLGLGGTPNTYANYRTLAVVGGSAGGVIDLNPSGGVTAGGCQISATATTTNINAVGPNAGAAASLVLQTGTFGAVAPRLTIDGSGNVGVGVTPSAGRGAIQLSAGVGFPATQVASSDANTLDDYEEGTFVPTIIGITTPGTGTYSKQTGRYTKIGNRVFADIYLVWSAHTGTGLMGISGLPFNVANVADYFPSASIGSISNIALTAGNIMTAYATNNSNVINLEQYPTGGGASTSIPIDTSGTIVISISYSA